MTFSKIRCALAMILVSAGIAAHAQLPVDNTMWKARCELLAANASAIQAGHAPQALIAATRGISSIKFTTLAVNRADSANPNVACTMYFLAAVAAQAGNGGKPDLSAANDSALLGSAEWKEIHGQSLSMSEHMKRLSFKVSQLTSSPLTLSPTEASNVIDAAGTMPLSLNGNPTTASNKAPAIGR